MSDDEYPTAEEQARYHKKLFDDEFEDHPTDEQIARNKEKLGISNVVPISKNSTKWESVEKDDIIKEWNKPYSTAYKNGKFKVIMETDNGPIFLDQRDFVQKNAKKKMLTENKDPQGHTIRYKLEPIAKYWLEHANRRDYDNVIVDFRKPFNPLTDKNYNLFRGFPIKAVKGQCYKNLMHYREHLCGGNKDHFRWLMAWVAHMFQRPWELPETAVAIQGEEEGTGKSFFPKTLGVLLNGQDGGAALKLYFKASNAKMITGDFSGHLEGKLLLHAEEAFRADSEKEDAIIKDLITGADIGINPKNIEAKLSRNYMRLMLTGNPPHIVKAGRFARRFLVLKASSKMVLNTDYFRELSDELALGGYEALMYYWMHYPIHKYNLRVAPKTEGLLEQKLLGMTDEERFWYNLLYIGELPFKGVTTDSKYYGEGVVGYIVVKYKLFNHFQRSTNRKLGRDRSYEVVFGKKFAKFLPKLDEFGRIIRERGGAPMKALQSDKFDQLNSYVIPCLSVARQMFDAYLGQPCDWAEIEDWAERQYSED
jgi:Family of unknown function (DUF5906)